MLLRKCVSLFIGLTLILAVSTATAATPEESEYPKKPVRIVVGTGAGGAVDLVARLIARRVGDAMGQQFIVENRVGAAGSLAASFVAKAPADGYTLLVSTNAPLTTNLAIYKKLDYKWEDFEPIVVAAEAPVVLIVAANVPIKTGADLIALSRQGQGLTVATTGSGSIGHFVISDMMRAQGANLINIPYKTGVAGVTAVSTGEAQIGILDTGAAKSFIRDGRVRALGIVGGRRASALPDVPTLTELNLAGSDIVAWVSFVAPKGTPRAITRKLATEIARQVRDPELRQKLIDAGVEPVDGSNPEQFEKFLREEVVRWRERAQSAGLILE